MQDESEFNQKAGAWRRWEMINTVNQTSQCWVKHGQPVPSSAQKTGAVAHYHFSISFSPPSIYYIYYVDPCLFCCAHKDVHVHGPLLSDSFPLCWWDCIVDKSEATLKRRLIQVVFMQRLFDFCLSERRYWEDFWQNAYAELTNKPFVENTIRQAGRSTISVKWHRAEAIYGILNQNEVTGFI